MLRAAFILAALVATPAAAAITLDDLDPLTRGICEQLAINAECPVPETTYVPKAPPPVIRPRPRPDWCETAHAWRFFCTDLTGAPAAATGAPSVLRYYGPGRPAAATARASAHSGSVVLVGGRGGDHHDGNRFVTTFEEHHHYAGCPCGCCEAPEPPEEPAPIPLPGSVWLMLAGLGMLWRMREGGRSAS